MELHRVLVRLGWVDKRKSGHWQMTHPDKPGRRVSIPMHRTALLPATLTSILDQAAMSVDELREHL
jgi:predicted RNA binding protein YcfA (HicA-like mRNA interferase family)